MLQQLPSLETRATKIGGANAIALIGELDVQTAPQLTEEVELAVWSTVGAFVLDLSGVTFLDSSRAARAAARTRLPGARGPVARAGVPGRAGAPRARPRERARHVRGLPDGRGRRGRTGSGRRIKSAPWRT